MTRIEQARHARAKQVHDAYRRDVERRIRLRAITTPPH